MQLVDALARLAAALAWPAVALIMVVRLAPAASDFISSLGAVKVKAAGVEASATRQINVDDTSKKLRGYWKPNGRVNAANAARIADCMRRSNVAGSVPALINAGIAEDPANVVPSVLDSAVNL